MRKFAAILDVPAFIFQFPDRARATRPLRRDGLYARRGEYRLQLNLIAVSIGNPDGTLNYSSINNKNRHKKRHRKTGGPK
ncbi:hypothetical protein [Chromobacterium alticapitis]|uniref:hypothetical protein n=1 Tax=Chromobacterium alticapitis TaxID=2073169 RepID=UPI0011B0C6BE|nr:hypothetical protein [Chromobacterium alticapitis]